MSFYSPPATAVSVMVGSTAVEVGSVPADGSGMLTNSGMGTVYYGTSSSVSVSTGTAIYPGPQSGVVLTSGETYWAICPTGYSAYVSFVGFQPPVGSGSGGNLIDVSAEFGVDVTGTVNDNSSVLNSALATLAAEGLMGFIPPQSNGQPAVVNVANTITLGNGNQTSGLSAIQGGGLIGAGFIGANFIQANSNFAQGLTTINWTGANPGGPTIVIEGPLWGWRLENLYLTSSASTQQNPFWNKGGCGGYMCNVAFDTYTGTALIEDVSTSSAHLDCLMNEYDHIFIDTVPSGQVGIQIGPNSKAAYNCCFSWFHDIWVPLPASNPAAATYAIYDNGSDTLRFDRIYTGPNGSNAIGYHAYAGGAPGYVPGGHVFDRCDFQSKNSGVSVSVSGGTIGTNGPITFRNLATANGTSVNPQIAGIVWECPETPLGVIAALPVYGTAFTNTYGVPITIYPTGGTTSAVTLAGTSGFPTTGPWRLGVGESMTLSGTGTFACKTVGD